jgi:hypothetical protein
MDYYKKSSSTMFKTLRDAKNCAVALAQGSGSECSFWNKWQKLKVPKSKAMMSLTFRDIVDSARSAQLYDGECYDAYCSEECVNYRWDSAPHLRSDCGHRLMVCKCPLRKGWRVGRIGELHPIDGWQPIAGDFHITQCGNYCHSSYHLPLSMKDTLRSQIEEEMISRKTRIHLARQHKFPTPLHDELWKMFRAEGFKGINESATYIYGLRDIRTDEIRYVGQTKNLLARYKKHLFKSHSKKVGKWIAEILFEKSYPVPTCLDLCHDYLPSSSKYNRQKIAHIDSVDDCEKKWIRKLRSQGCRLLNHAHNANP